MHQAGVPRRNGDSDTGRHEPPLPRSQGEAFHASQVGPGITLMGVRRRVGRLMQQPDLDLDLVHGLQATLDGMPDRGTPLYSERLFVPVGLWLTLLAVTAVLSLQLAPFLPWAIGWTVGGMMLLMALALAAWSTARVRVVDGHLVAPGINLPCREIASVEELDQRNTRAALGTSADPAATLLSRPWLRTSVRVIPVSDAPPYLLIGTRRPEQLADALVHCAEQADTPAEA